MPNDWNRADAERIFGGPVSAMENVISLENGKLRRVYIDIESLA